MELAPPPLHPCAPFANRDEANQNETAGARADLTGARTSRSRIAAAARAGRTALPTMCALAALAGILGALPPLSGGLAALDPAPAPVAAAPLAQATVEPGHVVVRGRIFYRDRDGDRNHPASGVKVEVWDLDRGFPATGELLDTVHTDVEGRYTSNPIDNFDRDGPTGARSGNQDVFLKIFTEGSQVVLLEAGTPRPFVWTSYEINPATGKVDDVPDGVFGFPDQYLYEHTPDVAAMWAFVDMTSAWFLLRDAAGRDPGSVTGTWGPASADGPRYEPAARRLVFRNEDARYGDLIGQYTAYALLDSLLDPLPAEWSACLDAVPADPRLPQEPACALLHGLAMSVPLIASGSSEYSTPAQPALDFDAATFGTLGWDDGDAVPGRVAGAFWDLHEGDGTVEEHDRWNATFTDVFEVVDVRRPVTLADWWSGWLALGKNGCTAVASLFQNTIAYNTPPRITPVPDIVLDEDTSVSLDLRGYVSDDECGDDTLVFELADAGAPEAGVVLLPTNVISVTPAADWWGRTTVRVTVSDGLLVSDLIFGVIVNPVNDCPVITPRVPDPPPAPYGAFIELDLSDHAADVEDGAGSLAWDVELPASAEGLITVGGRGTDTLTFLLSTAVRTSFSVIVTLTVRDSAGCTDSQPVALYWTIEGNTPPRIDAERFAADYYALVNTPIEVDLTDAADDREDGRKPLEWFVLNPDDLRAQAKKLDRQRFEFIPFDGFVGSTRVELEVQDTAAARTTAAITLTWRSRDDAVNLPPVILRDKLRGKTVGIDAQACYELTDKAVDPDHNQLSLRWFAEAYEDDMLFVGPEGGRRLCLRSRAGFEGCLTARFIVRDPRHAEDAHDVETCWRQVGLYMPFVMRWR